MNFDKLICLYKQHSIKIANITITTEVPSDLISVNPYLLGNHCFDFEYCRLVYLTSKLV